MIVLVVGFGHFLIPIVISVLEPILSIVLEGVEDEVAVSFEEQELGKCA